MRADTFIKLEVDTSHATFAKMTAEAIRHSYVAIGSDNTAGWPHVFDRKHQRSISGLAGHSSRFTEDTTSVVIGVATPLFLSFPQLGKLDIAQIEQVSRKIQSGILAASVWNLGESAGDAGEPWQDGTLFVLDHKELRDYFIEPRRLWVGVAAAQLPPAADVEEFIFLPGHKDSSAVIETEDTANSGIDYDITIWGFNPIDTTVYEIVVYSGIVGNTRIKFPEVERHHYILPTVSNMGGVGPAVDVKVGFVTSRVS
jgi:hypothetical protein